MAWSTPPPVSPAGTGIRLKKCQSRLPAPFTIRFARMRISGRSAISTEAATRPTMMPLRNRRQVRRFTGPCSRWRLRGRPAR